MGSPLVLRDKIYGQVSLRLPVLVELIKSAPVQRLKNISQFGVPDKYYFLKGFSRYEHSIGVMFLLNKLGACREEQIAGLLHDVSHTAFSHVIDFVVGSEKFEDFQDSQHERIIKNSEIPKILHKYGYNYKKIADYHNFPLLEQDIPNICADRIDYALREFPLNTARKCYKNLEIFNNKIVFADKNSAILFARKFVEISLNHWGNKEAVIRYRLLSGILKIALSKKIISQNDLWKDEEQVLHKLENSQDAKITLSFKILKNKKLPNFRLSNNFSEKKFRFVDPLFIENQTLKQLSKDDLKFKTWLWKIKKSNEAKKIPVPRLTDFL